MVRKAVRRSVFAGAAVSALALAAPAGATQPQPWEINLQPAATPIM